ncbi:MAG: osmoprotectant transport system permease protein [Solirubrobacteraceae bacterium]|jgi:osmoprotectant transport system permease protein|nr:osmoprotectant transport system permease protein [Solirubrobacteraceae bacterium]
MIEHVVPLAQLKIGKPGGSDSCVANNGFCPDWIAHNLDRYWTPLLQHVYLTVAPVAIGFVISLVLAIIAHRRRWLTGPIITITGIFFAIPSVAAFFLLQPITGLGYTTAMVALVSYTLLIIFRNITTGLRGVPSEAVDAARGQGLTDRQVLYRVELPLAIPEIMAGLRVAVSTTVGLAALAVFAGAGGLGAQILRGDDKFFKSNVVVAGGLCVLLAAVLDLLILGIQRLMTPWQRASA